MTNKNIHNLSDFKSLNTGGSNLNELVEFVDGSAVVTTDIIIPQQLINAFIKKVKDESGRDIKQSKGDAAIAEMIANYIKTSFVNIENLPVSIVLGQNYTKDAQIQNTVQPDVQNTVQQIPPTQVQAQPQVVQPQIQTQTQTQPQPTQTQEI